MSLILGQDSILSSEWKTAVGYINKSIERRGFKNGIVFVDYFI